MNSANFQNFGGSRMVQQGPQQHGSGPGAATLPAVDQNLIYQELRNQPPLPPGWQSTYSAQARTIIVAQLITQLRLVKPAMTAQQAHGVAVEFERREFYDIPDKNAYESRCRDKLQAITQARQNQANMQQQHLQNQVSLQQQQQMMNPPQTNPAQQQMGLQAMVAHQQHQIQQQMGIPQPQIPMQTPGGSMQQQQLQQQRQMQLGNTMGMQHTFPNGQAPPNGPQSVTQNQGQMNLSAEDGQHIHQIMRHMVALMSPEDRGNMARNVQNMPDSTKQSLIARGFNPSLIYIQNQATQKYMQQKKLMAMQRNSQGLAAGNGMIQNQARPTSQTLTRPQAQQPQQLDQSSNVGQLDKILTQQQDALRHQEAGHAVVPASNSHGVAEQQRAPSRVQRTPQQQSQAQFAGNRPMQTSNALNQQAQPFWNNSPAQTNIQQPRPMQMPPTQNMANLNGQTPQQQALQGQIGGLNTNPLMRAPEKNPVMPTLNRPMGPASQPQNVNAPTPSSAQQTARVGQNNGPNSSEGQLSAAANGQQRPRAPPGMPPAWAPFPPDMKQRLARMTDEDRKKFFFEMKQKQQEMRRQKQAAETNGAQAKGTAQQASLQSTALGAQNGQGKNSQPWVTPNLNNSQQGTMLFKQPSQRPLPPQAQGQAQAPQSEAARLGPTNQFTLNDQQTSFMDRVEFPPAILNASSLLARTPEGVKTWGQLKEWVDHGAQNLPPGSLEKLKSLQGLHYTKLQGQNKAQQHMRNQQSGVAPAAQTVPPRSNQTPVQSLNSQGQGTLTGPPQPHPNINVQAIRAQLPENMKVMTDDQIRMMFAQRRKQAMEKAAAAGPQGQTQQQQIQHERLLRAQQFHQNQAQATRLGQGQQLQQGQLQQDPPMLQRVQQNPKPPVMQHGNENMFPGVKRPGPSVTGLQGNEKGIKRNNNSDDVIEVPDPKLALQQPVLANGKVSQTPRPQQNLPQFTREQYAQMTNEQKHQWQAHQRSQAAKRAAGISHLGQAAQLQLPATLENIKLGEDPMVNARIKQLAAEVARAPPRSSVPMSPKTRAKMTTKLKDNKEMIARIDASVQVYLQRFRNEEKVKEVLQTRMLLAQQVRGSEFIPVENFTITSDELERRLQGLHHYFQFMVKEVVGQDQAKKQALQASTSVNQPQQLSAANLQQQQESLQRQRAASVQRNHGNNRPPDAPTTSQPPYSFGAQSPQGIPQFYAPKQNELTVEKLQLPQAKRLKGNQGRSASSTPAQGPLDLGSKPSPFTKIDSPEIQRPPPVPNMIKCPISDCQIGATGFATKADLSKHTAENHGPKEPEIKNALEFALESLRMALNLDENGKPKPLDEPKANKDTLRTPAMKASSSAQGSVKQEVATPMSRTVTGTGPSPPFHMLKTPQTTTNIKTPASDAKSTIKDANTMTSKPTQAKEVTPDPWANSNVQPIWFAEAFRDVSNLNAPVSMESLTDWLDRQATPPLSPSTDPDKPSPHKSDISANDDLNISLNSGWMPPEWYDGDVVGEMAGLEVGGLMEMDWENAFGKDDEEAVEALQKGKGKVEDGGPSREWLKAWAPEVLEEKRQGVGVRKR